jgi:hypothetical protein
VKRRTRKLAVFATCLGIAGAVPVVSSADPGGVPNSNSKPCKTKKAKKKPMKPAPNDKGKKCGFVRDTTTTVASPTTAATTTVPTTTTP